MIFYFLGARLTDGGVIASTGGEAMTEIFAVSATVALNGGALFERDDYFAVSDESPAIGREGVCSRLELVIWFHWSLF